MITNQECNILSTAEDTDFTSKIWLRKMGTA